MNACFVTGTDTGVGKTYASCALIVRLAQEGLRVAGFKPVAAGLDDDGERRFNEDVVRLRAAGNVDAREDEIGPCQFDAACAPHIAAALEGRTIERKRLIDAAHALSRRCDALIVEGVGGFEVPLGDDWTTADLAVDFDLAVVLVVGMRLGCLNHALLTAQAVRARGLTLAGWVANTIDPSMPWLEDNHAALDRRLNAPCLARLPWSDRFDPRAAAQSFDACALRAALPFVTPR